MTPRKRRTPALRYHSTSGQGYVELNGRRRYLGKYEDPQTEQRYHALIQGWLANGREPIIERDEISVKELIVRFMQFAHQHYRKDDGTPTSEPGTLRQAMRPLRELYGDTLATNFGPMKLKAVRQQMIEMSWCRSYTNQQINRIRRIFKWAVEHELVSATVYQALQAVAPLKRGRCGVRESEPVRPAPDAIVDATLLHMTPTLSAMVQVQRLTGMRPTEGCIMRGCDLDTTGKVWIYRPESHKTDHHGRERLVFLGPQAQAVLRPRLKRNLQAYLFSPAESEAERRAQQHARRQTPHSCGNVPGSTRKHQRRWAPGGRYDRNSYAHAIAYACKKAGAPKWTPNQLRHGFATDVRRDHGLEAAQVLLGHATADVTQVYAERDVQKAVAVALQVG